MENRKFGARIRELRKQAGLTQAELAGKIEVSFTYLSKIESGAKSAPSVKIILRLAEALKVDKDELLILAGKMPSDIVKKFVEDREMLQLVRSKWIRKTFKTLDRTRSGIQFLNKGVLNFANSTPLFFKNHKALSTVGICAFIVLAIVAVLYSGSPAKALDISYAPQPSDGYLGTNHTFTVKVDIKSIEFLPIKSIDLSIYNVDDPTNYTASCSELPLAAGTKTYTSTQTGGGDASVTATVSNWNESYGYGYGYAVWYGYGYYGYGYDYGYGNAAASITYSITWTSPSGWPNGKYEVETIVSTKIGNFGTRSTQFTLSKSGGGVPTIIPEEEEVPQVLKIPEEEEEKPTVAPPVRRGVIIQEVEEGAAPSPPGETEFEYVTKPITTKWALVGGIIGAVAVIVALLLFFLVWRRRRG